MGETWRQMWDYLGTDAAWHGRNGLPSLLWAHLQLSFASLAIAVVVALPPAIVLGHVKRGALLAVSIVNIGRAVPSFAVIALLLPFSLRWGFGLGFWPTLVALVLLAVPPIFTNTYTGIRDVPDDALEAAQGMGMQPGELVRKVEVPVAMPLILTGLRISAVQIIATATLGSLVGFRCLGSPIVAGFTRSDKGPLLAAAILVAAVALLTDGFFAQAQRWLMPWRRASPSSFDNPEVEGQTP
ncbi:MAG TPA: ABC transporter permease [Acidimicrobiales bacterium]|nr:ABC transporter permease [Acidimicrobiales bacterium]